MRPVVDERGRLFGAVNLVDLLVVALLVVLVALAFVRFAKPAGTQVPIRSTFAVQRVKDGTVVQFAKGKQVRDDAGNLIGTIQSSETTASPTEVTTDAGALLNKPSPIFKDVTVEVLGEGRSTSSDYTVGNLALRVGKLVTLTGPGFEVKAQLINVAAAK